MKRAYRFESGFLLKLALSGRQGVSSVIDLPFWDRPGPSIFAPPEWSAWMRQQRLKNILADTEHNQTGALLFHGPDFFHHGTGRRR